MIGNDIVDLQLAAGQSNWRRKGFFKKVFTASEMEQIAVSEDQDLMVWLLWSMKEAVYKAHQRRFSLPRKVNWTSHECLTIELLIASGEGIVRVEGNKYYTSTRITCESLHTIAVGDPVLGFGKGFFQQPSTAARTRLLKQISAQERLDVMALSIEKNSEGVPFISYKNRLLSLPFSLSGHGRFSGFCYPLMKS